MSQPFGPLDITRRVALLLGVWSASTTTTPSGGGVEPLFQQFSELIVGALAKDGLV